ncbi:DNA/RNA non-specific endonuclease [Streptomyces sp. 796.1]|uniref:DNA/RNA non-specific endonuclease n=1 Tax=Streptomyces sp. 796.1 TaxID=3163029 RepID=UPI0039C8DD7E
MHNGKQESTEQQGPPRTADTSSCTVNSPNEYTYTRFGYCVAKVNVVYFLRDNNGKEVGRGTLEVSTSATLPKEGTGWDEQVTVKMTEAKDAVTTLNASFRAHCTTGCTVTKDAPYYGNNFTVNKSKSGFVSYSSTPARGAKVEFTTSYRMYVTIPEIQITDPNASWDNPRVLRCDDAAGDATRPEGSSSGCVVPTVMPVVPMNAAASDPGGLVAAYGWAQRTFNGAWGKSGTPLTRSTSGVAARTASTCGGFLAQTDLVDTDSCGDFPFGDAKEGGTAGAQCAQVIPNLGKGGWDAYVLNDAHVSDLAASPCVQVHVTPDEKQFADVQLAGGFEAQRVIDGDEFELKVSAPSTDLQISCRNDPKPPDDAILTSNGWFWNTTDPVALINKTKPSSGPGERPAQALACIGRNVEQGTDTSDPITGWEDAQDFKIRNNVTYGLDRCHLIARKLGGQGTSERTRKNLVPCWHSGLNTGTPSMRTFEKMAQDRMQGSESAFGANDAIFYRVSPVYKNMDSTIPVGVTMSATIQRANGTTEELFPNVYVTNTLQNTGTLNLGN